jgi:hypothetical protein
MAGILYLKKGLPLELPVAADHELAGYQEPRVKQTRALAISILAQMVTERTNVNPIWCGGITGVY